MKAPPPRADPDRLATRRVARQIAIRVALLSAVMVVIGALILLTYLFIDDRQRRPHSPPDGPPHSKSEARLDVDLDADDLVTMIPLIGAAVIVFAGGGALLFARQAVHPLEESLRRQRNFIGDASHELRTPLAVMDARIQQAQLLTADHPTAQPVLAELRHDSKIMADILNDLLATVSAADTDFDPAQLALMLSDVQAEMRLLAESQCIQLHVSGDAATDSTVAVLMPESELRRSLLALVDNALRHTPAQGEVIVEATTSGKWVQIRVSDTGEGITGIAPDQIFERFARGTQVPGRSSRGSHGIGLALVHDMAIRHGGSITVEHTGSTGTVMRLTLPIAKNVAGDLV